MRFPIPQIYCGYADVGTAPFLSLEEFRAKILYSLLFEGNLVIPDIFWFVNPHVAEDVLRRRSSVLLAGLKLGLIKPHFRSRVEGSFAEGLKVVEDQQIVGLLPNVASVASVLDSATSLTPKFKFSHWPHRLVGRNLLTEITQILGRERPAVETASALEVWERSRLWRTDCVAKTIDSSVDGTLRRGELLDCVARHVGAWSSPQKLPTISILLSGCRREDRPALRAYLYWVNQCYQRNQARLFRKKAIIPLGEGVEQLGSIFVEPILGEELGALSVLEISVKIPSLRILMKISPSKAIAARTSSEGKEYFRSFALWRNEPTVETAYAVAAALTEYAERLRRDYSLNLRKKGLDLLQAHLPTLSSETGRHWARLGWEGVQLLASPVSVAVLLLKASWSTLRLYRPESVDKRISRLTGTSKRVTVRLEQASTKSSFVTLVE